MLACMLGENREIFYPKLEEAQMMTFDAIAEALLEEKGYEVLKCASDEEAKSKTAELKNGSRQYPVHFSTSDTSGEKAFEEFVTDTETADVDRFASLGVITGKPLPNRDKLHDLLKKLTVEFEKESASKEVIVDLLKDYLPNFEHIETGKSLDGKM